MVKRTVVMYLRVSEIDPKFVGRGIALVDPKVMIERGLSTAMSLRRQ